MLITILASLLLSINTFPVPWRDEIEGFVGGALDEVEDIAKGTVNSVLHPVKALKALGSLIEHPIAHIEAAQHSFLENYHENKMDALGHAASTAAILLAPLPVLVEKSGVVKATVAKSTAYRASIAESIALKKSNIRNSLMSKTEAAGFDYAEYFGEDLSKAASRGISAELGKAFNSWTEATRRYFFGPRVIPVAPVIPIIPVAPVIPIIPVAPVVPI